MVYFGAHMTWMRKDERKNEDLSVGAGIAMPLSLMAQ
jgi:hypothetical protein